MSCLGYSFTFSRQFRLCHGSMATHSRETGGMDMRALGTVVVSGAGSGIGRAIAMTLASQGYGIVAIGRRGEMLEETIASLSNGPHTAFCVDIRDRKALRSGFKAFELASRSVVGVVANAGVGGSNSYHTNSIDRWDEVIGTNLTGTYVFINEMLEALCSESSRATRDYRNIVIVSSILARLGVPGYSAYCAAKAGLLGLMRSWAAEFAKERVLVNAICPGWVLTDMARDGISQFAKAHQKTYEAAFAEQMSHVPLNKMSQPNEVAALVAFLLSEQQMSITGQCLDINNGAFMP